MKTLQKNTHNRVSKNTSLYSTCLVAIFMLASHFCSSQELAVANNIERNATIQIQAEDTLNTAFQTNQAKVDSMMSLYFRGTDDADNNYKAKKCGKWIIFGVSIVGTPVLGLVPALITSNAHPSAHNLNVPEGALSHNAAYMKGYKDEAHDIKKRAIWNHYLTGSAIWAALLNVVLI